MTLANIQGIEYRPGSLGERKKAKRIRTEDLKDHEELILH